MADRTVLSAVIAKRSHMNSRFFSYGGGQYMARRHEFGETFTCLS
jgi:hypothetical protein